MRGNSALVELLRERNLVNENDYNDMVKISRIGPKLNNYIGSFIEQKKTANNFQISNL